jgi:trigger factor
METTLNQVNPVEYELEIRATADELESDLQKALRRQRSQMDMKGFRKGKVPMPIVKKMHGEAIGYGVAEQFVQDAFEDEVEESSELDVLGQPQLTELDYELDGDMRAVIRFGVRPEIELADLSDEQISELEHEVTDEDVEDEIEELRVRNADLMPLEDEAATEDDWVLVDLQRIDPSTDTPIIGEKEEDLSFFLDDDRIRDELREELVGRTAGETFRVELPQQTPQGEGETRVYEVDLKDVKRRDLPEVDQAFVEDVSEGDFSDPEAFRAEVRRQLENAWTRQSREMLQRNIVDRMLELHPAPVPESVVETYLDSFVEQVKQRNDGELPDDFDMQYFRQQNRDDAEKQGRWMLIRDEVIDAYEVDVTDEDRQEFFAEQSDEQITPEQMEQFYRTMPKLMERVNQQILSQKVFDTLAEQFDIEKKDREAFEEEMRAAHEHEHGHEHPHEHDHGEAEEAAESPIITE